LAKLGEIGSFTMHDYSTWRQDIQKIQTLLEDIDTQYPEDNRNDIKVPKMITEFKEYLTLDVIGNTVLPSARDLVAAITQYANAYRRLGREREVQANVASSECTYTLGPCFNYRGPHLRMNYKDPKNYLQKVWNTRSSARIWRENIK